MKNGTRVAVLVAAAAIALVRGATVAYAAPAIPAGTAPPASHIADGRATTQCTYCHVVTTPTPPPPAPPADTLAPVTTSDAVATYTASAVIRLTATDAGSGVASTHHRLDGGSDVVGTVVATTALGLHTLEFWSVDVAGNVEATHSAVFAVVAPAAPPSVDPSQTPDPVVEPGRDDDDHGLVQHRHRHHRRHRHGEPFWYNLDHYLADHAE